MKNDLLWKLIFRTLIFVLGCTSSYLLAYLIGFPKGTGWILIVMSGILAIKAPVAVRDSQTTEMRLGTNHTNPKPEPKQTVKKENVELRDMQKQKEDSGIRRTHNSEGAVCLIDKASRIYREIFAPIVKSDVVLLQSIGQLAEEAVSWLVDNGDVQSVVSKFDFGESKNVDADAKYEALKRVSLFDHSFNTCMHAFDLSHYKYYLGGHPVLAYMAATAGLLHDIGKHPNFYPRVQGKLQYKSCDHPMYSVAAINYFIKKRRLDASLLMPIIEVVGKHHQADVWDKSISSSPPLAWFVQQADYAARDDEMKSMQHYRRKLEELNRKEERNEIIIDGTGSIEKVVVKKPGRPLNLKKAAPVPHRLRDRAVIVEFFSGALGDNINRYVTSVENLDLATNHPAYGAFSFNNDLMVRMSFLERSWEDFASERGVDLRQTGEKFPMQAAIKGLLQYLDHIEPGLVQRLYLPEHLAFIQIQVQQGFDHWTKTANYVPFSLPAFLNMTGMNPQELENRKFEEDDLAGRDLLGRICGWKKC